MKPDSSLDPHAKRQDSLRAEMEEQRLPCLLVTNLTNIAYLTGFRGSAGVALFTPREGVLWVDPRYTLQAQGQARGVEVIEERKGLHKAAAEWLKTNAMRRVGYEDAHLSCADFSCIEQGAGRRVKFVPAAGLVEQFRAVKDEEEVAKIRGAGKITVEVFEKVLGEVRPGVSESELSAEIEYLMRKKGAEGAAFETIVASGPRAALPHARASGILGDGDANRFQPYLPDGFDVDGIQPARVVVQGGGVHVFQRRHAGQYFVEPVLAEPLGGGKAFGGSGMMAADGGQFGEHDRAAQQDAGGEHHFQEREP